MRRHYETKKEKYSAFNQEQRAKQIKQLQKNWSKKLDCFRKPTKLSLPWEKLASVTTDGAKSMVGHKTDVIGLINSHMDAI